MCIRDSSDNGGLDFWGNPVASGATDIGAGEFSIEGMVSPGATVLTGTLFPEPSAADSSVVGASPGTSGLTGDDASISMSQSFQVDSTFDLKTIFLDYEYDGAASPEDILINVEIFEVADVGASTIVQGASLLTITGLSMPELAGGDDAAIVLDSAITLPANTGSEGYALRISNGSNPGLEWRRTGGSGSVYAFGQAYEDGVEKNDGERDWILALSETDISVTVETLLGDVNLDGVVNFLDISTFIAILSSGTFQTEADCNESGTVDFLDISPFIAILTGS